METVIVELNQRSAEYSKPGEYRVQLAQPIIINPGDQLAFRMASIDTLKTSADTIIVDSDLNLTAVFSYYDVDYSRTDKAGFTQTAPWIGDGSGNPTFDYFGAYNEVGTESITVVTTQILGYTPPRDAPNDPPDYTVPGGSFIVGTYGIGSATDPRINFSATFSYIDTSNSLQYIQLSTSTVAVVDPVPDWRYTAYGTVNPSTTGQQPGFTVLRMPDGSNMTPITCKTGSFKLANISGYWPGRYIANGPNYTAAFGPAGSAAPPNGGTGAGYDTEFPYLESQFRFSLTSTPVATSGLVLDIQTTNAVLKAGRYDPAALAVQLTQLFSSADGLVEYNNQALFQPVNPLLTRTDGPLNQSMIFRRMNIPNGTANVAFNNTNTYSYWDISNNEPIPYFIGASTFAIEYGQAGPVYQISYCHTPLSNPARPGEQDLGIYHYTDGTGDLQYNVVKSAGGIAIHDLQPTSFWQNTLGLRDKLIVPLLTDNSGVQFYDKQALLNSITEGFHGLGSFLLPAQQIGTNVYNDPRKVAPIPPLSNPVYIDVTGQSRAIIGESPSENVQEGFYLIEVLNFFRRTGGYLDSQENRINISAIASTQYLNANAITAFSDSGIPYQHDGLPYLISDAFVRILDPITKMPATGLGENTCIFLQIDRMRTTTLPPEPFPEKPETQQEHQGVQKPN
jgi:hypothetical protein